MRSKVGIALLWVFVFLMGAVAGAVSYHLYWRFFPPKPVDIVEMLTRELNLDNQQKESLKRIFAKSIDRYRALGQQYRPLWETIRTQTDQEIKDILRPDQRNKFEQILKQWYSKTPNTPKKASRSSTKNACLTS